MASQDECPHGGLRGVCTDCTRDERDELLAVLRDLDGWFTFAHPLTAFEAEALSINSREECAASMQRAHALLRRLQGA